MDAEHFFGRQSTRGKFGFIKSWRNASNLQSIARLAELCREFRSAHVIVGGSAKQWRVDDLFDHEIKFVRDLLERSHVATTDGDSWIEGLEFTDGDVWHPARTDRNARIVVELVCKLSRVMCFCEPSFNYRAQFLERTKRKYTDNEAQDIISKSLRKPQRALEKPEETPGEVVKVKEELKMSSDIRPTPAENAGENLWRRNWPDEREFSGRLSSMLRYSTKEVTKQLGRKPNGVCRIDAVLHRLSTERCCKGYQISASIILNCIRRSDKLVFSSRKLDAKLVDPRTTCGGQQVLGLFKDTQEPCSEAWISTRP